MMSFPSSTRGGGGSGTILWTGIAVAVTTVGVTTATLLITKYNKSPSSLSNNNSDSNDATTATTTTRMESCCGGQKWWPTKMKSSFLALIGSTTTKMESKIMDQEQCKHKCVPCCPVVTIDLPNWLYEYQTLLQQQQSDNDSTTPNFTTDEEMMNVAIIISQRNVIEKTGGPFGCAIFERTTTTTTTTTMKNSTTTETTTKIPVVTTKLLSVGANRVTILNNSTLHGEMVAIQFAQKTLQTYSMRNVVVPPPTTTKTTQTRKTSNINHEEEEDVEEIIVITIEKYYILATSCEPCCMCLGGILWCGIHELLCGATKHDAENIGFNEGPVFDPQSYEVLQNSGILIKRNILQKQANEVLQDYSKVGVIYNC